MQDTTDRGSDVLLREYSKLLISQEGNRFCKLRGQICSSL